MAPDEETLGITNLVEKTGIAAALTNAAATATTTGPQIAGLAAAKDSASQDLTTTNALPRRTPKIDFLKYADPELFGDGEAKQKMRKFDDDFQVAQRELGLSQATLEGTQKLYERGFVTKSELDSDSIKVDNSRLKVQTAGDGAQPVPQIRIPQDRRGNIVEIFRSDARTSAARARQRLQARPGRGKTQKAPRAVSILRHASAKTLPTRWKSAPFAQRKSAW